MRKSKYNSSGSGPKPSLGRGKPHGLARPTSAKSGEGVHASRGSSPKAARPGGTTKAPKGGGSGSVARPGGAQSISR